MTVAAPAANGARTTSRPAPPRPSQRPPSALELIRSADSAEEAPPELAPLPMLSPPASPQNSSLHSPPPSIGPTFASGSRAAAQRRSAVLRARVMEHSGQTGSGQRWADRRLVLPPPQLLPRLRVAPGPPPRHHRHQPRPTSARCPSMPRRSSTSTAPCGPCPAPCWRVHPGLPQALPGARSRSHHRRSDQPEVPPRLD